jgi:hypothetical protein
MVATDTSDPLDNLEKELVTLARRLRGLQRTLSDEAHPDLEPAQYALLNRVEELAPVPSVSRRSEWTRGRSAGPARGWRKRAC